jgi:subtilisin-like proprotein convertase family protein
LNNRDVRFGPAPISILNTARPAPPGNANLFSAGKIWEGASIPLTYTLFDARGTMVKFVRASFSPNGGGQWYTATAASGTVTQNLSTRPTYIYSTTTLVATSGLTTTTVSSPIVIASTPITQLTDLDVLVTISHARVSDLQLVLQAPTGLTTTLMAASTFTGTSLVNTAFDNSGTTTAFSNTISVVGRFRPAGDLAAFNSLTQTQIAGTWNLLVRDTVSGITGTVTGWSLHMQDNTGTHVYYWDPLASGFFGQSDNVIVRLEAVASITNTSNAIAGPYLYGAYAAQTFPFRVRGTQVRVISNTTPVAGAFVYRLPAGDSVGGALVADDSGNPFTTNAQGYLQGRGQLNVGDQLLALYPISATNNYTLYYTNGTPNLVGEDTYTVTTSGVQTLTVSAVTPLYLFDLDVSLEWDASNDAAYQEELLANLQRASEYFYNFTDGQMAFGNVNIWQNADNWGYSHVVVKANNRIRPFAIQGGVVTDTITDTQHSDITYGPGQVTIGSTWNRYGRPGQTIGDDWPLILAHELSHYLLFHDDTYLGLDADGHLKAVSTCKGSAMGDIYNDPLGPNFVFSQTYWLTNCGETLPAQTLGRTEWQTMVLWYPGLVTPSTRLDGPSLMPYDFTRVQINAPLTATTNLIDDPTFYADYANQGVSSNEARAYIVRGNEYVIDLGSPFGGQNRLVAHGAQVGDYLCVFDRPLAQFGCETIALGDDHLQMKQDSAWAPVIQIAPVNSVTLDLHINNLPASLTLRAQLYPEFGYSAAAITLTEFSGVYSGTFTLAEPTNAGHVQVWVANDTPTETNPRRETMVAFSVGGNSGALRAGGGALRAGGGALRAGGGALRAGGGALRAGGAPVTSPDGQMTFFTENPIVFNEGEFYTIQGMAGLPTLPPGRTVIGQGYSLLSTPNTPLITGSVSIQYLSNDVLVAGANEDGLTIYFYDGNAWTALDTTRDAYFNLASAPSQGVGVYALMASVQVPLNAPGWNLFSYPLQESQPVTQALLSISGTYSAVYGFYAEDATHPWKLYATGVPTYVNDLITLDPGRGYWISATQAVTVHFSNLMPVRASLPASPPDTFYGVVQAGPLFTPAAGQTVQARIGGAICGQGATQIYNGQIVYVVDVLADDGVANAGCGQLGRSITFVVNGQIMRPGGAWDNNQLSHLDLSPVALYLPIIRR